MASRSKKILEMINLQSVSPVDPCTKENVTPNQDGHDKSPIQEVAMDLVSDSTDKNTAVNVVMLSDVTNCPENKAYLNIDELSRQNCRSRKREYTDKQELSENKKKDLKELVDKNFIPNFYKDFYDTVL